MELKVIVPVNSDKYTPLIRAAIAPVVSAGVRVDIECLDKGVASIESQGDLTHNSSYVIDLVKRSAEQGYQGVFVWDMDICGVEAARQSVSIPVVGGLTATAFSAMFAAQRFSVLTVASSEQPLPSFASSQNLASMHSLDFTLADLVIGDYDSQILQALTEQALIAVERHGAQAIIFGCTGFIDFARPLMDALYQATGRYIAVMDPNCCAISYLQLLVSEQQSNTIYH